MTDKSVIDQSLLDTCIHCGLCLPACPTYLATGRELESPRGRIALLNLWQQGQEPFSARMAEHLDSCLGCLGCQTACPSGVNYEALINQARPQVNALKPAGQKLFRNMILAGVLTNDSLLVRLADFLRFWQKNHCDRLVSIIAKFTYLDKLPLVKELLRWQALLTQIPEHKMLPGLTSNPGKKLPVAQLFKGCVMDIFYNQVNHAAIKLLSEPSQIVGVPKQTCCGALALHAGEKDLACRLARENMQYFAHNEGPIVVTASGCTAMLKTYPELFAENDPWHEKAMIFSRRVKDLPEFLAQNESTYLPSKTDVENAKPLRIAYHAACHLAHAQGIHLEPKQLLENYAKSINDAAGSEIITLVPLTEEEHCCGSAGTYNLSHAQLSETILARKIEKIKETGADIIVTTNPGCLMQIEAGMRNRDLPIRVIHLAQLLANNLAN